MSASYNYTDIAFDCETYSVKTNALIIQLAAVPFNPHTGEIASREDSFDVAIDWSQFPTGDFAADAETIHWWMGQPGYASMIERIGNEGKTPPAAANLLVGYVRHVAYRHPMPDADIRVWGLGAKDDIGWIEFFLEHFHQPIPWMHYNRRCLRTLLAIHPEIGRVPSHVAHDAYWDARAQAATVVNAFKQGIITSL